MRSLGLFLLSLLVVLVISGTPAFAHHGNSAYDENSRVTLKGIVTEFVWANPHCQIYLDVPDANGKIVHWAVETNSPGRVARDGWSRDSLKKGDHITISVIPAKNGSPVGYVGTGASGTKITFDDGRVLGFSDKE